MGIQIGPWTFTGGKGHLLAADSGLIPTSTGYPRRGRPKARPAEFVTYEEFATLDAAWVRAFTYRATVGALASRVVDDLGQSCDYVLVQDCAPQVRAVGGGAGGTVTTRWVLIPPIDFGAYGVAQSPVKELPARILSAPPKSPTTGTGTAVGVTGWTAATGTFLPPILEDQAKQIKQAAKAIGVEDSASDAPSGAGDLTTYVSCSTPEIASRIAVLCRRHVGRYVAVRVGGVKFAPVGVLDVEVDWTKRTAGNDGNAYVVEARWSFGFDDSTNSGDTPTTAAGPLIVEVADVWGAWSAVKNANCEEDEEAIGGTAGAISFSRPVGKLPLRKPGQRGQVIESTSTDGSIGLGKPQEETVLPVDLVGKWVRLRYLKKDERATTSPADAVTVWHGRIHTRSLSGGPDGAVESFHACEIISALAQCYLTRWYEYGRTDNACSDPGEVLAMNADKDGDQSPSFQNIGGSLVPVHGRNQTGATTWTAGDALNAVLAAYHDQYPQAPRITVTGQTSGLRSIDQLDLEGKTIAQMLVEILSPATGSSFRLYADNVTGNWMLRVFSLTGTDVAIPGGGTLPANERITALADLSNDKNGSPRCKGYEYSGSGSGQADRLYVQGSRPWQSATLAMSTTRKGPQYGLAQGWTKAEEDAWDAAASTPELRNAGALAKVWRRYVLAEGWDGSTWNGASPAVAGTDATASGPHCLPTFRERTAAGDAIHGNYGETGRYAFSGSESRPLPRVETLKLTRSTPLYDSVAYDATPPYSQRSKTNAGDKAIQVFAHNVASGTYEQIRDRWQVDIVEDGAAIVLGTDQTHASDIKSYLSGGKSLVFTLGMEHPLPWRVSWESATPLSLPRTVVLQVPWQYRFHPQNTVSALKGTNTLEKVTTGTALTGPTGLAEGWETSPGSGVSALVRSLRLARLWFEGLRQSMTVKLAGLKLGDKPQALNDPPANPAKGDTYLVGTGTGAWNGHNGQQATWNGVAWDFSVATDEFPCGSYVTAWKLQLSGDETTTLTAPGVVTARRRNYRDQTTDITTESLQVGADRIFIGAAIPPVFAATSVRGGGSTFRP